MSALRLAERIPLRPVMTVTNRTDASQGLLFHTFVYHADSGTIFETGHHFGKVRERDFQSSFRPGGHQQTGLISHHIRTHIIKVTAEILHIIIFHDTSQCRTDMLLISQISQTAYMGHILSDQLIDQATFSQLKRRNLHVRIPHIQIFKCFGIGYLMFIIFPVE